MKLVKDLLAIVGLMVVAYMLSGFKKGPAEKTGEKVGEKVDRAARFTEQELHRTS